MKIAITGKGGVGKTTFSSMLSRMFADDGYRVVAVDADPDANLGLALGFPKEVYDSIVPGTVDFGGSGCVCPEHVLLKRLCSHLILQNKDVVVMDMEAGIEHLGRGTAQGVDAFIVVVEPGERSLQTYRKVKSLGKDIGIKQVFVVGNKIRNKEDEEFIMSNIEDGEALGFIYYNQDVINSDRSNKSPYDTSQETREQIEAIKNKLMGLSVSCN